MRKFSRSGLVLTLVFIIACGDDSAAGDASVDSGSGDANADSSAPPATGLVGSACVEDADCQAGLSCFQGPEGARPWPGGYCTRDCSAATDCPGGSICGIAYDVDVRRDLCQRACVREAGSRSGCREGYRCGWQGFCTIGCSSDDECRTDDTWPGPPLVRPEATCVVDSGRCRSGSAGAGVDGASCTQNADCAAPNGRCLLGECRTINCDLSGALACSGGEACAGVSIGFDSWLSICLPTCRAGVDGQDGRAADERCGLGYDCRPAAADPSGRASEAMCYPTGLPLGMSATATLGDACVDGSDCPLALGYSECIRGICSALYCAAPELSGQDVCGPGARCIVPAVVNRAADGFVISQGELGICERDCSADASVCLAPSACLDGSCTFPVAP